MINKTLNIGIDIDGTITGKYDWLIPLNKYFNKNITEDECVEYDLRKLFNVNNEEWHEYFEKHHIDLFKHIIINKKSRDVINVLKQFCNCYFISARRNSEEAYEVTKNILIENDLGDIPLYLLGSDYKFDKCKELNINYMIEDNPYNAIELANNNIKVFLIDTNYNKNCEQHENIKRVDSFYEILYYIMNEKF